MIFDIKLTELILNVNYNISIDLVLCARSRFSWEMQIIIQKLQCFIFP